MKKYLQPDVKNNFFREDKKGSGHTITIVASTVVTEVDVMCHNFDHKQQI